MQHYQKDQQIICDKFCDKVCKSIARMSYDCIQGQASFQQRKHKLVCKRGLKNKAGHQNHFIKF